ncbi:DUF2500 domain-containing protein [Lysinibacillus antri]|uniref:DUF2500 domain-containing protein n=1 Tax=Lysinibacillus antri TaxID=2498145 RepID=A0A3S0WGS3_9BACI|nr:DUF2500 domain-containing protein [Lysinibacillus antri]RUL53635.1 DUF2500 domain-containing protein [Lysinibacillus antri]
MFFGDLLFNFVPIFIGVIFIIVIGTVLHMIFSSIKQGAKNNASPTLTVPAKVVTKRTSVFGDHTRTTYYTTFEVESGDRMEFQIAGEQYGLLAEDDLGLLTFQGTRFITFERKY